MPMLRRSHCVRQYAPEMKCPFCDTEFEMEALQGYDEELNNEPEENMSWDTAAGGEWQEGEQLYIQKEREWLVLRRRC